MIIDLQRRIAEVGRIRIGEQVPTSGGRTRPAKLTTFRLTSQDKLRIDQAAQLYGGTTRRWESPAGPAWEVITEAAALDVIVPPSDMAFSQSYEMWSAGGCVRRCDGQSESISDGPCLCNPDHRDCAIHTRLSVLLRDVPGLGVWRIDTSGYYAAVELQGAVEVIQLAAGRGQMLPARLRLDQRTVKRIVGDKPMTRRFAVPVLDVDVSPGELLLSGARPVELSAPPLQLEAVMDGSASLTPVPDTVPARPIAAVADQMRVVSDPAPRKRRANSAQPVPPTRLAPRTVAEVQLQGRPPSEPVTEQEPPAEDEPPEDELPASQPQLRKIFALLTEADIIDRDARLRFVSDVVQREITSSTQLTVSEASAVIDRLDPPGTPT